MSDRSYGVTTTPEGTWTWTRQGPSGLTKAEAIAEAKRRNANREKSGGERA
jgi:hypothetical protein